ncbi:MAG: beta-hydroxyacyl-ACP dehydratase [Phycisphaerae bacterium]
MRFVLTDRISELDPGKRVVAHKALSLAEEYLSDHFPAFPVLPGVLMLEAMVQASAWVARVALEFRPSLIVLKEARNVTYKSFVAPGQILTISSICKELQPEQSVFQAAGEVDGRPMVKGQLVLRHLSLSDSDPRMSDIDGKLRARQRELLGLIWKSSAADASQEARQL